MSTKLPWAKWHWADWISDLKVKLAPLNARGLWMEMLAIMAREEPYGYLQVGGQVILPLNLAGLASASEEEVLECLDVLEKLDIFSRDEEGRIYSRRMLRELEKRRQAQENGRKGGNPKLRNRPPRKPDKGGDKGGDNPQLKQKDKLRGKRLEDTEETTSPLAPQAAPLATMTPNQQAHKLVEDKLLELGLKPPQTRQKTTDHGIIGRWLKACGGKPEAVCAAIEECHARGKIGSGYPYLWTMLQEWGADGPPANGKRRRRQPHTIAPGSSAKDRGYDC